MINEIKNIEDIQGKIIVMCPKCNSQVSILEENTICKKCSDYNFINGEYFNLVRHEKFIININTIEKQIISNINIKSIQGIPLTRFSELIGLFIKEGFYLKRNKDWKKIKKHFFNIIDEDLK